jgi:hypothetical protein
MKKIDAGLRIINSFFLNIDLNMQMDEGIT